MFIIMFQCIATGKTKFCDALLIVQRSITLVNDQLDVKFFHFIIRSLQSPTCFEQRCAHQQEVKFY